MQYEGIRTDGLFMGKAIQGGHPHLMVQVSAAMAHMLVTRLVDIGGLENVRCTRMDVQLTLERLNSWPLLNKLGQKIRDLQDNPALWKGRRTKVRVIDNDNEIGETVYIGSRESEVFTRIYDKSIDNRDYVRFECEYKSDRSHNLFIQAMEGLSRLSEALRYEIVKYTKADEMMRDFNRECKGVIPSKVRTVKEPASDERTLKWLQRDVGRVVRRLQLSGMDKEVEVILKDWLEAGQNRPYITEREYADLSGVD